MAISEYPEKKSRASVIYSLNDMVDEGKINSDFKLNGYATFSKITVPSAVG